MRDGDRGVGLASTARLDVDDDIASHRQLTLTCPTRYVAHRALDSLAGLRQVGVDPVQKGCSEHLGESLEEFWTTQTPW
jgi:hypothetical protein